MIAKHPSLRLLVSAAARSRGLPPTIAPHAAQTFLQVRRNSAAVGASPSNVSRHLFLLDQLVHRNQLPLQVVEQLLVGDLLGLAFLVECQVGAQYLQRVVQQQADRQLEKHRLRHRPDQVLERKYIGDLVENPLDAPPLFVRRQQTLGGIRGLVQQIRDQC